MSLISDIGAAVKQIVWPSMSFWPQDWDASMQWEQQPDRLDVTPDSALGIMAYYAGIRVLAESVASLPLIVYRRLNPGKERAPDHPLYRVLHDQANPEMTSFTWRETAMGHVVGWGNSFNEKQFDGAGRVIAIWPLRPDRMTVRRNAASQLIYQYRLPAPDYGTVEIPARRILHIRGLAYDGLVGYSPATIMRRALQIAHAAQEYGERTFENNGRPGVVLTHPKTLSDPARDRLENSWAKNHQGLSNAQRTAVLEEGVTVTEIGFPPEDTQFLETQKFQVRQIARGMRLPPHMIGDLEQATFSNIEQQAIDFVTHSLRPWLVRWEQQLGVDLIPEAAYFAEFLIDALLRGDLLSRSQGLWIQRQAGVLNADEWREMENRNPLPDGAGQVYLQPLNMTTIGSPPPGAEADLVKPSSVPNPAIPAADIVPDTLPVKPTAPSKNGREKVPA
jgi:HK97 family phage portal protein